MLVLSFVALGALWSKPKLDAALTGRPLPRGLERALLTPPLVFALRTISVLVFLVVWAAAAFGSRSAVDNLAPTFVYVLFWLGLPALSVLLGDVWAALDPWTALGDAASWAWRRAGRAWQPPAEYPGWLGVWPAAILLLSFTALELAYSDPANPRALGLAIGVYSWVTWLGRATFGREAWLRNGDGFKVYFGFLARLAVFSRREGRLVARAPLAGLATDDARPGVTAFVAVMLGSVAFDGFSRTAWWTDRLYSLRSSLVDAPGLADLLATLLNLGGLLVFVLAVAATFLAAVAVARRMARPEPGFARGVLWSLVPIAFAYVVAHYFSLFVLQGQFAIRLASDPFGRGWDLLGTSGFTPNLSILRPNTVWYVQVGALVGGHVLGLAVAHDRALAFCRSTRAALRSQYAILALMVLYTVGGLWLLSQG